MQLQSPEKMGRKATTANAKWVVQTIWCVHLVAYMCECSRSTFKKLDSIEVSSIGNRMNSECMHTAQLMLYIYTILSGLRGVSHRSGELLNCELVCLCTGSKPFIKLIISVQNNLGVLIVCAVCHSSTRSYVKFNALAIIMYLLYLQVEGFCLIAINSIPQIGI